MLGPFAIALPFLAVLADDDEKPDLEDRFQRAVAFENPHILADLFKPPAWYPDKYRLEANDLLISIAGWVKNADSLEAMQSRLQFHLDLFHVMKDQGTFVGSGMGPESVFTARDTSDPSWYLPFGNCTSLLKLQRGNTFGGRPIYDMSTTLLTHALARAVLLRDFADFEAVHFQPTRPVVSWDKKRILVIQDGPSFVSKWQKSGFAYIMPRPHDDVITYFLKDKGFDRTNQFLEALEIEQAWLDRYKENLERERSERSNSNLP